eukprot:EG_transcript_23508
MDDDFDGLLDSALDEFHSVHEEEEGKRQQRQRQRREMEELQRQKEEQDRVLQQLKAQLRPAAPAPPSAAAASASSSSSSSTTAGPSPSSGAHGGGAPLTAGSPSPAVPPDDLLDAALDDYADGERQAQEARQKPNTADATQGPPDFDDHSLHHALEMFTTALGTLVEGSDEPEFAKLAETLSALAKDVGGNSPAEDDEAQMAKVLESVESLRRLVGDDPELVQALDAAKAELTDTAGAEAGGSPPNPPTASDTAAAGAAAGPGGAAEPF